MQKKLLTTFFLIAASNFLGYSFHLLNSLGPVFLQCISIHRKWKDKSNDFVTYFNIAISTHKNLQIMYSGSQIFPFLLIRVPRKIKRNVHSIVRRNFFRVRKLVVVKLASWLRCLILTSREGCACVANAFAECFSASRSAPPTCSWHPFETWRRTSKVTVPV